MSNRLTKYQIERAMERLLEHRFKEERDAVQARLSAVGDAVYEIAFPEAQRRRMDALPKGWLPEVDSVRFQVGDAGVRCSSLSASRRVPDSRSCGVLLVVSPTDPVALDYESADRDEKSLNEDQRALRRELRVLYQFTTLPKLRDAWPEAVQFFAVDEPPTPNLPAVKYDFQALSEKLRIKPS